MVQTSINEKLAFGFPGAHANIQPWVADAGIAGAAIKFGTAVALKADGTYEPYATGKTFAGIAVGPHQHVLWRLPSATASLTIAPGDVIAVAKKGAWYVALDTSAQFKVGDKVAPMATNAKFDIDNTNGVAEIIAFDDANKTVAAVRFL